ncbi:MAG: hypothetical protein BGP10_02570 [Rhodanobacter sp. 68-29]|nr:hypothetical protein [Rhodanobacter sp.]ODU74864.1 MAG: hypothetical protein ABT17_06375 [Rhodanobacter sp. SCN 69-32]OJY58526.1 MAG: hypothetical protein BGP10_02570 [Rhodanobacter sp. 68-29]
MPVMARAESGPASRGFALWRVVVWLLLLLAAFGCVQYFSHAQLLWAHRANLSPADSAAMQRMLAWDIGYLVAALVLIVLCAGCILRQAWARAPLRVAAGMLVLWALVSGGMMVAQWPQFDRASAEALAQLGHDAALGEAVVHARRVFRITMALKGAAIPVLLWLAWRLGTPAVRMQFRHRR